jgi:hypothetical protein
MKSVSSNTASRTETAPEPLPALRETAPTGDAASKTDATPASATDSESPLRIRATAAARRTVTDLLTALDTLAAQLAAPAAITESGSAVEQADTSRIEHSSLAPAAAKTQLLAHLTALGCAPLVATADGPSVVASELPTPSISSSAPNPPTAVPPLDFATDAQLQLQVEQHLLQTLEGSLFALRNRAVELLEILFNDGNSEGARKGWVTRRWGGSGRRERKATEKKVIRDAHDEIEKVLRQKGSYRGSMKVPGLGRVEFVYGDFGSWKESDGRGISKIARKHGERAMKRIPEVLLHGSRTPWTESDKDKGVFKREYTLDRDKVVISRKRGASIVLTSYDVDGHVYSKGERRP